MRKDFAEKLPPTYRFLRGDGSFAVSYKKGPGTAKTYPARVGCSPMAIVP
jgi:hypothetical protein